jgi:predicted MPP superfamily phosphohydrolase
VSVEAFFVLFVVVVALLHVYLDRRLLGPTSGLGRWRRPGRVALGLSALAMMLAFLGGRWIPRSDAFLKVQYVGFFAMGLMLVLAPVTLLRDVLLMRWRRRPPSGAGDGKPDRPTRREALQRLSSLGVVTSSVGLTGAGVVEARWRPRLETVWVPIAGLPRDLQGLRIVQISDLHVGPILRRAWLEEVVTAVNQARPDLIAITGDLIDGTVDELREEIGALRRLRAPLGKFFVTGNHEYYWDARAWVAHVRKLGLTVLLNEHRLLEVGTARLLLCGVADLTARSFVPEHASDPAAALEGAPEADVRLLLAHQPKSIDRARRLGYHLQLSGHTHGGQFFPWNLVIGLFQPLAAGLGRFDDTWLYVNRGTGTWGPPLRTGVPAEITVIELTTA